MEDAEESSLSSSSPNYEYRISYRILVADGKIQWTSVILHKIDLTSLQWQLGRKIHAKLQSYPLEPSCVERRVA